ncbi:MAG: tRNA guanosine(34) transglycosylase Tgt [Chloroflexota bacterium]|nr:tRNA guanosine(34) transglycosylase Tgt [Chloroflexota bacterium]
MSLSFHLGHECPGSGARAGTMTTPHGVVPTPAFIPVGTQATVKALTPQDLSAMGATMVLCNTYHLSLRPGAGLVERMGGLHRFMGWEGPILTDSGGYQVFSLAHLRRVSDEGVLFRSHIDGSEHFITPERCIELQEALGADIIMPLDECHPYGDDREGARAAMARTHLWAERCRTGHRRADQALFAIVQGGTFPELRRESAAHLASGGFAGYAIGGLSIGEPKAVTWPTVEETVALLPRERPRYLMGVGSPEDLVQGVARGIDMFDSALPTRVARNGGLFTARGRVIIRNACYQDCDGPIEEGCDCYTCQHFSAAYLHHLFRCQELLAYRLATVHNLRFVIRLMAEMREHIGEGSFPSFARSFLDGYEPADEEVRARQRQRWIEARRSKGWWQHP